MSHTIITDEGVAFDPFRDSYSAGYTVFAPGGAHRTVRLVPTRPRSVDPDNPPLATVALHVEDESAEPMVTIVKLFQENLPTPSETATRTFTAAELEAVLLEAVEDYNIDGSLSEEDVNSWAKKAAEQIIAGQTPATAPPTCPNCDEQYDPDDVHADAEMCGSCHHNARRSG